MITHHHTKFGYKRFSSWGGVIKMNIHWNFEPFLWLWPLTQWSIPVFLQANPAYDDVPSNQVQLQKEKQFRSYIRKSYFCYVILHCDLDLEDIKSIFSKDTWLMMMHHHTKFGGKRFSSSKYIVWTNIQWHFEVLLWPWPWTQQSNIFIRHCLVS